MPKGNHLAEFEVYVMLAIARLGDGEAYGVTIRQEIEARTGRPVAIGAVYATLGRLHDKSFVSFSYSDPDHKIEYTREEFLAELDEAGFEPEGAVMPVVLDTPWAGVIDAMGGVSLSLYDRLSRWKREAALRRPEESTGFRVVARKRRS